MGNPAEVAHGYMLIGLYINLFLYGIMTTQVYLYFIHYKHDKRWIKLSVFAVFILDSANSFFLLTYLYTALIVHFDDPPFLQGANWMFATDPVTTGLVASLVQLVFGWRIRVLTRRNWLFALVIICAFVGGVGSIVTTIEVVMTPDFVHFRRFKPVVILWLAAECIGDILITTILRNHKTGFPLTDKLVDRIIRLTMETGLSTSVCASLDLMFFLLYPNGIHLMFNFTLSNLYANSLMATLNARRSWNLAADHHRPLESVTINHTISSDLRRLSKPMAHSSSVEGGLAGTGVASPQVFVSVEGEKAQDTSRPSISQTACRRTVSHTSSRITANSANRGLNLGDANLANLGLQSPAAEAMWNFGAEDTDWASFVGDMDGRMARAKSACNPV